MLQTEDVKIFLDIGANYGTSSIHIAEESKNNLVYAFEPNPKLYQLLKEKTSHLLNYTVIPKAVSNFHGRVNFNIDSEEDGCSSLLTYHKDKNRLKKLWYWREYNMDKQIRVDVIRLDDFIRKNKIKEITHLHCDAQGHDLQVLMGLGAEIYRVKQGVIEMASSPDTVLYQGQIYTVNDAVHWLEKQGLKIDYLQINRFREAFKYERTEYQQHLSESNEWNIYFHNPIFKNLPNKND
jgi:FkbM family methyltransferase